MINKQSIITNQQYSIVFFGSGAYGLIVLENLDIKLAPRLILTTDKNNSDPVARYAIKNKIEHKKISNINNATIIEAIKFPKPQVGILANFGLIIPNKVLELFPKGILNIHPSLLPKYRGPTPVQTAILNGDTTTGITIIKMDEEIDHGPMLIKVNDVIKESYTAENLYLRLFKKGTLLLNSIFEQYINNKVKLEKQIDTQSSYTLILKRSNGYLDISKKQDYKKIKQMIKAYFPWPGTWTKLKIKNLELRIKFLPDEKIQVEGKKPTSYKDFLNGYPNAPKEIKELIEKL